MSKTILIFLIILVIIPIAWYLISPIFRLTELDEPSPLIQKSIPEVRQPLIKDSFESMTPEMKAEFEVQTDKMEDIVIQMADAMPSQPTVEVIAQAPFMPRAHEAKGKALLISADSKKILRFEDFETINGPDLHIYLSRDLGGDDYIDLGAIRATKGNVNYEIPIGTDTSKYNKVLVWCVPFRVIFSYAELQ
ncbi:MAG: DM13 domain-containing protein [Candidatus Portnoybacteria bacterium]|nr:DM13 domain-containing protein [Candidatus Portnoybacteria bacterium]